VIVSVHQEHFNVLLELFIMKQVVTVNSALLQIQDVALIEHGIPIYVSALKLNSVLLQQVGAQESKFGINHYVLANLVSLLLTVALVFKFGMQLLANVNVRQ